MTGSSKTVLEQPVQQGQTSALEQFSKVVYKKTPKTLARERKEKARSSRDKIVR